MAEHPTTQLRADVSECYARVHSNKSVPALERSTTYHKQRAELEKRWKENYLFSSSDISPEILELLYAKAWEDGHADGYFQVEYCFNELVILADKILELAVKGFVRDNS